MPVHVGAYDSLEELSSKIGIAKLIELPVLLKYSGSVTHLYSRPGRIPKGWSKCHVMSRQTWLRTRLL